MINQDIDIAIVGGGLTGATLMLALENKGYKTLLIESKPLSLKIQPDFDARTLALSPSSQRILKQLNLWQDLATEITPIEAIEASRQFHFGRTYLKASEWGTLGFIVEMQTLNRVLFSRVAKDRVLAPASVSAYDKQTGELTIKTDNQQGKLRPKLIVAADGSQSTLRSLAQLKLTTKDYQQDALVTNIGLERSHNNKAFERFTASGPLALLPTKNNKVALVWALSPQEAKTLQACEEKTFLSRLQKAFGYKLGPFTRVGKRVIYPLRQSSMPTCSDWPLVFIGNAAQTLHPVAGQGFNLGLRDVATLAECIAVKGLNRQMVESYTHMRSTDQQTMLQFTDGLVRFFSNALPGFGLFQSLGLVAMDQLPFLQKILVRQASGFGGMLPDLVCHEEGDC